MLLCLFCYVEEKSQTASSAAVFSVLGKIRKERKWRVLSQSLAPYGRCVLGFSFSTRRVRCMLVLRLFSSFPKDFCSHIIRVDCCYSIFLLENWMFFLLFLMGFFLSFVKSLAERHSPVVFPLSELLRVSSEFRYCTPGLKYLVEETVPSSVYLT